MKRVAMKMKLLQLERSQFPLSQERLHCNYFAYFCTLKLMLVSAECF